MGRPPAPLLRWLVTVAACSGAGASFARAQGPAAPAGQQGLAAPAGQQGPAAAVGLTLTDAIVLTIAHSPTIRSGDWTVRSSEGVWLAAGAPFDPTFQTSATGAQVSTLNSLTAGPLYYLQRQSAYSGAFTKEFEWGLTVSPTFSVANTGISIEPGLAQNSSQVGVTLGLPLLRDRWGAVTAAAEHAAERDYQGSVLDQRTNVMSTVLNAASAYWAYLAAVRTAEVYAATEGRAAQTVADTRLLVAADERTPADLNQTLGDLATQHAARVNADQAVIAAREQLGLTMGIPADSVLALATPTTDFPVPGPAGDSAREAELVDDAVRRRPDVAALAQHRASTHLQTQAARNSTLPRLDLQIGVGYTGLGSGWGFTNVVQSFNRNVPGMNVSVELSTNLSIVNSGARGQVEQTSALEHQQAIAEDDLRRHVRSDVAVALAGLRASADALSAASEAVAHANETLDAQRQRFKSGLATVFDVLLSEDALTNAHLAEIADRQAYALAIAALRYSSGTLLAEGHTLALATNALVTPP
jgi:outer membrane protein